MKPLPSHLINPPTGIEIFLMNAGLPLFIGLLSTFAAKSFQTNPWLTFICAFSLMNLAGAIVMKWRHELSWQSTFLQLLTGFYVVKHVASIIELAVQLVTLNHSLKILLPWRPIYPNFPHVLPKTRLGLQFNATRVKEITREALQNKHGIATSALGFVPIIYVARQEGRGVVRETHVGVIDQATKQKNSRLFGGNGVMDNFLLFEPYGSSLYKDRRAFLMKLYHEKATIWLRGLSELTYHFLKNEINRPQPLDELVARLVLHTSSFLLGLNDYTLDKFYHIPGYRHVIDHVAHYCVADWANPAFEEMAYALFLEVFEKNFSSLSRPSHGEKTDHNLIQNLFISKKLPFPESFDEFLTDELTYSKQDKHDIAMSFCAIALAGMTHSNRETFGWDVLGYSHSLKKCRHWWTVRGQ